MKGVKQVVAVTLIGALLLPLAGCAKKIERIRTKDFEDALEEVFDDDEYGTYGGTVYVLDDHYTIAFRTFDDDDDARDEWEDILEDFDDMKDDKNFDGRTRRVDRDTYGYILLNGECDDDDFVTGEDYVYGGIYYVEDEIFIIITTKDKDDYRDDINAILRALGLPRP